MRVVINTCYGGFGISMEAIEEMASLGHKGAIDFLATGEKYPYIKILDRSDPILVDVVEKLGDKANGQCAKLKIVDAVFNFDVVDDCDGMEKIEFNCYVNDHC
jgi:hypothetical protein